MDNLILEWMVENDKRKLTNDGGDLWMEMPRPLKDGGYLFNVFEHIGAGEIACIYDGTDLAAALKALAGEE